MIAALVYILCALTSLGCGVLLWRGYRDTRVRLLFWSAICFLILALSNALLFADMVLVPGTDLQFLRSITTLVAVLLLLLGLVFESR